MHKVYLSLGSNLGHKEENIRKAIELIGLRVGLVARQSSLISTEPWGFESDNQFVNAAVLCHTELSPREVLRADIDILLYDELRVDEPDLQIPHPLMLKREFVMRPLREIRD